MIKITNFDIIDMSYSQVIYKAHQQQFFTDVENQSVVPLMHAEALRQGLTPGDAEVRSWGNNAPKIAELLRMSGVYDTYVTFEYLLPRRLQRIDCMIYGKNALNQDNVIHIELKQWGNETVSTAHSSGNFEISEYAVEALSGGSRQIVAHPSQQVRGYHEYLTHFLQVIDDGNVELNGVAYCYNYLRYAANAALYDPKYDALQSEFRTYAKDEVRELAEKIHEILGGGEGFSIFNKMMKSPVRESQKLLDSVAGMIDGDIRSKFNLLDEQIAARNAIFDAIRRLKDTDQKSIVVVHGGPGTGKTVIALDVFASLAKTRYQVHYATKSASLINAIHYQLPNRHLAKKIITGLTEFNPLRCEPGALDVLLIDEAHRIESYYYSGFGRNKRKISDTPQIDSLLAATKVLVVFIDDAQAIRSSEVGSTQMMEDCALRCGATLEHVHLYTQFRCNGSDNYLDWIEQVIYNKPVVSHFGPDDYDFKIMDSPSEVFQALSVHQLNGQSARLMAGFCWPWSPDLDANGQPIKDVRIGDFAMPWETHRNHRVPPKGYVKWYEWAYKPEGFKQVGCIYTAQGFEFDYAGVIIGPDVRYDAETDSLVTDVKASQDPMLTGLKGVDSFDTYCRNIYRVLLTRGMKGTYVYCCDPLVKEYLKRKLQ